jgi:hypothetical protein
MKTIFWVALALLFGIGIGIATAYVRLTATPWEGLPSVGQTGHVSSSHSSSQDSDPKLVIDQAEYNFGSMDLDGKGTHDFVVHNRGAAMLKLTKGGTSCRCAVSNLERESLLPGESEKITLEYKPTAIPGPYNQTATFYSNDPSQPRFTLSVKGKLTAAIRAVPAELVFSRASATETTSGQVRVYCYRPTRIEIRELRWSDPKLAEYFESKLTPLGRDALDEEKEAQSGYQLDVTIKPGLPQGPFQQKILLTTNLPEKPKLTLPIGGKICSDISIWGQGWNDENDVLLIGTLKSRETCRRRLLLIVRGPHRKGVTFRVAQPVPEPLKVALGQTVELNNGKISQTPLTIEIPQGSRPVNHLGQDRTNWAKITLETTHPQIPHVPIFVQFAVEE